MDISVQSFLNSANTLTITVSPSTTVSQLKTLVFNEEGTTASIMVFYADGVEMVNTQTMAFYSITTGSYVASSNNISDPVLWTKPERQVHKLELAQLRRQADGDTTAPYYRTYNVYDVDLLADKYISNTATVGTTSTLAVHRPWTT